MNSSYYPIIIMGSGPSGISTALYLQKSVPDFSDKILIIEKSHHPREKICGGALTGNALKILIDLGIALSIPKISIKKVRFSYDGDFTDLPEKNEAFVIRRDEFDNLLANKAIERGLKINQEEKVIDIKKNYEKIDVITTKQKYSCRVLVGADGVKSSARNILKFPVRKLSPLLAIEIPVKNNNISEFSENFIRFDFSYINKGLAGYIWSFPCLINNSQYLNIGVYKWNKGNQSNLNLRKILTDFLVRHGLKTGSEKIKGYAERDFSIHDTVSMPGVILVGESAGIDPLLGEGISQSLQYGRFASTEIIKAFKSNDFSFKDYKKNLLKSDLGRELKDLTRYANYFYNGNYRFWLSLILYNNDLRKFVSSKYFRGYGNFHKHKRKLFFIALSHKLFGNRNLPFIAFLTLTFFFFPS